MITTPETRKIYESIQKQLFYLIPEKWDGIYLYASVVEQMLKLETGELFFYYFPKGILRKNPVNVYEIPSKFSLDEEPYIKLVEKLYATIKSLRQVYKDNNQRLWSSVTIRLVGLKFELEFNYENLANSRYTSLERHIIWKYKNLGLPIETFNRKERKLIIQYLNEEVIDLSGRETYRESVYKRPIKNVVEYNREKVPEEYHAKEKLKKEKKELIIEQPKDQINYVEEILAQRKAVKSQILKRM